MTSFNDHEVYDFYQIINNEFILSQSLVVNALS